MRMMKHSSRCSKLSLNDPAPDRMIDLGDKRVIHTVTDMNHTLADMLDECFDSQIENMIKITPLLFRRKQFSHTK